MDPRTPPPRRRRRSGIAAPAPVLAALAGVFAAVSVPAGGRFAFLTIATLGSLATVFIARRVPPEDRDFMVGVLLLALAARFLVMALIYSTIGPVVFAPDAVDYQRMGTELVQAWTTGAGLSSRLVNSIQVGYAYINGVLFLIFGTTPVAPQTLNIMFAAWLGVPLYWITYNVTRKNGGVARWAVVITLFFPSLILWSTLNIREAPTILTVAMVLFFITRFQVRATLADVLGAVLFLVILATFREYLTLIVGAAAGMGMVVARSRSPVRSLALGMVIVMALTFAAQNLGLAGTLVEEPTLSRVEVLRQDMGYGASSSYGEGYDVSTPGGAIRFLPVGLAYFLLAPFPWAVSSFLQATTLPEILIWYALIPFGLWGISLGMRHDLRSFVVVISVVILTTFAYAMVEGNVGTAYRHRGQILPLMFVFVALGLRDVWAIRAMKRARVQARRRDVAARREGRPPGPTRDAVS